ncbi:MAG TPA: SPOR domain-containing protein [Gemmatimonadales bacterium]
MTPREVARVHFANLAPTLLADHAVVAVTPAGGDAAWSGGVAWETARAVARAGRRVLLVDLSLEQPVLATGARDAVPEGIVDAFAFGVALNHVAREQEPNLFFVGTGSRGATAEAVLASERWQRLARGFASEGALLLLYVPATALSLLLVDLGTVVVAAPAGFSPDTGAFPGLQARLASGTPLAAVVREEAPPAPRQSSGTRRRVSVAAATAARRSRRSGIPRALIGSLVAVAVLGVLAFALARRIKGTPTNAAQAPRQHGAAPTARRAVRTLPILPAPADSLFYGIQIAAFDNHRRAVAYLGDLQDDGVAGTVTPVALGRQGMWHRVVIGAVPSPAAADSLLRDLWRRGRVRRPNGTILRTPYTLDIGELSSAAAARDSVAALRRRGIAAYIVASDGPTRLLVGALEDADQARLADSLLRAAGLRGALVHRAGPRS